MDLNLDDEGLDGSTLPFDRPINLLGIRSTAIGRSGSPRGELVLRESPATGATTRTLVTNLPEAAQGVEGDDWGRGQLLRGG